jgi:nucleoside 2-deoxyribosyltransferase
MEKRYQVFVSSTFQDLQKERQEVMHALLELDCIPSGMELFPAANETQWELIKRVIDDCDYYILILGGRYGSIGPDGISYTEMEYNYAISIGKPTVAFLHKQPGKIESDKSEKNEEGRKKLDEFRVQVEKKLCKQ